MNRLSLPTFLLLIAGALLAPLAAAQAPTTAEKLSLIRGHDADSTLRSYLAFQAEWAHAHEADGDRYRAAGENAKALEAYLKALSEVAAGATRMALTLERDRGRGGYRVTDATAGKRAALGGVQAGDLLVAVDGVPLRDVDPDRLDILLYMIDAVPVRPYVFTVKRGDTQVDLSVRRAVFGKFFPQADINRYRDALEEKILRFMIDSNQLPAVTDNMRAAAGWVQDGLKNAVSDTDLEDARDNVRGLSYAAIGWGDFYLNCGLLLEASGAALQAEQCFRNFLLVKPDDPQAALVAQRHASLAPMMREEQNLNAWQGTWVGTKNGERTDRGYIFERYGRKIEVKNHLDAIWLRGNITGEFTADALQVLTSAAMGGGSLGRLIDKCFGGKLEAAGTMRLSQDKKTLTISVENDVDIDPANCAIIRRNLSTMTYVR